LADHVRRQQESACELVDRMISLTEIKEDVASRQASYEARELQKVKGIGARLHGGNH
jgi:hypothetical protein